MVENLLSAIANLNAAGVRANLQDNYNPANVLEKADENQQTVRFKVTEPYCTIPYPQISSAGNLNITFCLKGKAIDILHDNTEYDAISWKTISLVKNKTLFKQTLAICPDDIQLVNDLGYTVNGNILDLTQFDLVEGLYAYTGQEMAVATVKQMMYDCTREIKKRVPKVELTGMDEYLAKNGLNDGTWAPIITSSYERVKNTGTDSLRCIVDGVKCPHHIKDILPKISASKKKVTPLDEKIYKLSSNIYADIKCEINTIKYCWMMLGIKHTGKFNVNVDGVDFEVEITG
jgi:hypothetical protein